MSARTTPSGDPHSLGIAWDYLLRFADDQPQPRADTVYLLRTGRRDIATRARLLFRVPLAGREPDGFILKVANPDTTRTVFELDAYGS